MKHLGKNSPLPTQHDPSLLEAIPRSVRSRAMGYDVWHAYEATALRNDGVAINGVLKLTYEAESDYIIESKSLKLYLYSLANTHLGDTTEQVQMAYELIAKEDISRCLGWGVECCFFTEISTYESVLDGYKLLEKSRPFRPNKDRTLKVATHGLATLCPVTGQPDWGTLMLQITGDQLPTREDLFQLLRDLRGKPEFHEDVANRLYEHFQERYEPTSLLVACLYTRRGGIDICPVRYSFVDLEPLLLTDTTLLSMPTFRR